jgi:DNA-binding LacI/PurR family transcriptional regulator
MARTSPAEANGAGELGRATMRDVAGQAGVSIATVSRVINAPESVRAETIERVRAAMGQLAYVPDSAGRSLASGRTGNVGILLLPPPHVASSDVFFMRMLRGVEAAVGEAGLATLITVQAPGDPRQERVAQLLASGRIDGLIVMGESLRPQHRATIERAGLPLVLFSPSAPGPRVWLVASDSREASRVATRHLLDGGRRRVAHIGGPPDHATSAKKLDGYRLAHAEAGLVANPHLHIVEEAIHSFEGGLRATDRLLQGGLDFDALYAADDLLALGALRALTAAGRRVPEEVALVGYGDLDEARFANPPLTTVHVDFRELGWLAGTIMARALTRGDLAELRVRFESPLIVRESSRGGGAVAGEGGDR